MSEETRQRLQIELSVAEQVVSRLRAEEEALTLRIETIRGRKPVDTWLLGQTREQLTVVTRKIEAARAETLRPRIELLRCDLPAVESKVTPLQIAYDEAMSRYRAAREEADRIGLDLNAAQVRANSIRREILEHEETIAKATESSLVRQPTAA
jgi:chromosome segregation ATPase